MKYKIKPESCNLCVLVNLAVKYRPLFYLFCFSFEKSLTPFGTENNFPTKLIVLNSTVRVIN